MQNKVPLAPYVLLALALVGLGDTFYLSYYQYLNLIPSCAIGGCEIVLTSAYSKFFGVPLSYIGLVYYGYMLCLSVLLCIEPRSSALRLGALLYSGLGLLLSVYFIFYIQLTLLHAICEFCAISAIATLFLFCVALWQYRANTPAAGNV